jgi:hypothetical protein
MTMKRVEMAETTMAMPCRHDYKEIGECDDNNGNDDDR